MQRVAIFVPSTNLTVVEEFQRYVNNPGLIFQFFKLNYLTHKRDNEKDFYYELENSLKSLIGNPILTEFERVINMCSSLNVQVDNKAFDSNIILKEYLKRQLSEIVLFLSPYSKDVTNRIIDFLEINPTVQYVNIEYSIDYYKFGKGALRYIAQKHSGTILVSCTNIPTLDLIYKDKYNIISTNLAIIDYLNKIGKEER